MRYTRIKLTGFAGIKNGLGLDEIEIDLSRCINNILMIVGYNGCGKSTLWNAINPLPDDNGCFISILTDSGKIISYPACKEIDIDNKYFIKIIYGVKSNGDRDTPKIHFHKLNDNDERIDLNPNLNVNSYKEVLYNELGLDSNFLALSKLGQKCNSLVNMTPSDRKKFINSIITDLADYNDIYKTLVKRSSIYKSFINNSNAKISSIGDKEYLTNSLIKIETQLNKLMNDKDIIIEDLAKCKSIIQLNDPTGDIQRSYNELYSIITNKTDERKTIASKIISFCNLHGIDTKDIQSKCDVLESNINENTTELRVLESDNISLLSNRESKSTELQKHNVELMSLQSEYNYIQLEQEIQTLKIQINEYKSIIDKNNIVDRGYTIDSLSTVYNIVVDIINLMKSLSDKYTIDILQSVDNIQNIDYDSEISNAENRLNIISNELTRYNTLLSLIEVLDKRPSSCNIDSCPFISNAVNALNQQPRENISKLESEKHELDSKLVLLYSNKLKYMESIRCKNDLDIIDRSIYNYKSFLSQINLDLNSNKIIEFISSGYYLENELNMINNLIEDCNVLLLYNNSKSKFDKLDIEYQKIVGKKDMIEYIQKSIDSINRDIYDIDTKINNNNSAIRNIRENINSNISLLDGIRKILSDKQSYDNITNELSDYNSKMFTLQSSMRIIQENLNSIEQLNSKLEYINKQISPMIEDRDTLKHSLRLLEGYLVELEEYNNKYSKIELIKKYCSPSKGIGLAFMSLYLNSTLNIANDLMDIIFNGDYCLVPFNISENEFKIPCIGNAIPNDDISSMSGGEVSIISIILSFSILYQSSTKFNIFELDEVDAQLDSNNRRLFVDVLYRMIEVLGLDQIIMISHNQEIPMSNVDLIILKTNEEYNEGNVIYKYTT